MNKRQKKKFSKKLHKKKFYNYRLKRLENIATKNCPEADQNKFNMIYILDSKRGNLKHIHKLQLLVDCYPISSERNLDSVQTDIEFSCEKISESSPIKEMLKMWAENIKGCDTNDLG